MCTATDKMDKINCIACSMKACGSVTLVDGYSSVPVQDSDSTGTQSLINDCFDCLTCIVGVQSNRSALVSFEVPEVLCRILERKSHGLLLFKDCV